MEIKQFIQQILQAAKQGASSVCECGKGADGVGVQVGLAIAELAKWKPRWKIEKYENDEAYRAGRPSEVLGFDGNLLLNEGINAIWTLVCGGSETAFNNANARIGVGDSSAAAAATQTDLQAATNKLYKAMDATYPTFGTNQKVVFRSTFGATEANWAWNEITVDNGAVAAKSLNRKVQAMGTKANPAIWIITLEISLS